MNLDEMAESFNAMSTRESIAVTALREIAALPCTCSQARRDARHGLDLGPGCAVCVARDALFYLGGTRAR